MDRRADDIRNLASEMAASYEERKKGVADLIQGFRADNEAAAKEWRNLRTLMARTKAGKVVGVKPKVAKPPVPEAVGIEDRILDVVKNRPGITLKEIGDALGLHFVRIAADTKSLVESGKLRKEGKLYYLRK
ncbi:MAG: hypothetical protein QMD71_02045 [bacterium]|nr:hypothetical protein [bacterium]